MLDTLIFSINAVAPMTILMALGVFLNWRKMFTREFFLQANKLSFRILLPVMLFCNIYDCSEQVKNFDWNYVLVSVGGVFVAFILLMILIPKLVKDKTQIGPVIQGIYRSNFLVFGTPVVTNMFGEGELWTTSMLMPFIIPVFNILAVLALTWYVSDERGTRRLRDTAIGVFKNPLIVGAILSYLVILSGVKIPNLLYKSLKDIKSMGTPLALIALGGTLTFSSMKRNAKLLIGTAVGKLLIMPVLILVPALIMGYRGSTVGALLSLAGSPTAVSSYVMAQQTGNDGDLAGQIIAVTTIFSVLTVFSWIFALRSFGFL